MAHKYHDVVLAWLDGKDIQRYNSIMGAWVTWTDNFDCTPPFGSFEWRVRPEASPVEKAGITKDDLLAYFDGQNLYNDRNGLILHVSEDDGTDIPKCEVVVGNDFYIKGDFVWCDLSYMKKVFP